MGIMLQSLIPAIQAATAVSLPLAVLLALLCRQDQGKMRAWAWLGVILGLAAALFMVYGLKSGTREIYGGLVSGLAFLVEMVLLTLLWRAYKRGYPEVPGKIPGGLILFVVAVVLLHRATELILFISRNFSMSSDLLNTDFMVRLAGILLGLGLAFLIAVAVYRAPAGLPTGVLLTVITAIFLALMVQQAVVALQVLLATGILPMIKWLLAIMIPLINHQEWFFFSLLAAVVPLPLIIFRWREKIKEGALNPAKRRKILAASRSRQRWGVAVALGLSLTFLFSTVGKIYANPEIKLSVAAPVTAVEGEIRLPLEAVGDGKLHRFVYTSADGTGVRFIAIKKSGSAYAVALDACEICGPAGYYQRKGQVVCKNCDVVINTSTIGFRGGCNPVPLEYKIAAGNISVQAVLLETEKKRFR